MPYIEKRRREDLLAGGAMQTSGELNFLITQLCIEYINIKGKRYSNMNDVIGALEGAKLEFYRRVVANYEDQKIKESGDVYPPKDDK